MQIWLSNMSEKWTLQKMPKETRNLEGIILSYSHYNYSTLVSQKYTHELFNILGESDQKTDALPKMDSMVGLMSFKEMVIWINFVSWKGLILMHNISKKWIDGQMNE